mgnify:CR=1 FL=1
MPPLFASKQTLARIEYLRATGNWRAKKALIVLNFLLFVLHLTKPQTIWSVDKKETKPNMAPRLKQHWQQLFLRCGLK